MPYVPWVSSAGRRGLGTRPVSENLNSSGKGGKECKEGQDLLGFKVSMPRSGEPK